LDKGKFIEENWNVIDEFQTGYSNVNPDTKVDVACPGCGIIVSCDRWMGFDEGPAGWCSQCSKGVVGPNTL